MNVQPGMRLGHYAVTSLLGRGGMGEVWSADDARLGRAVALKVLPSDLASDPARLARFEREARVLASLNHSNIAHVYGFESVALADGATVHFLAMELVAGEDLAAPLSRGALPLEEALAIADQIAQALAEAHDKGIVHRDLKPANVKVTPEGRVKVLDFGLAKAYAGDPDPGSSADLSQSPTLAHTGTQAGVILGTASYMSPEQARGKLVDKRADVWAFGVVLHEMLTGRALFTGDTVSDVLAAVLTREPDWSGLPEATPPAVRRLLRRCLARDPRERLHDISDARFDLREVDEPERLPARQGPRPRATRLGPWLLLLVTLVAAAGWLRPVAGPPALVRRYLMALPEGEDIGGWFARLALSPDGSRLVYVTEGARGVRELILRPLDQLQGRRMAGTEGAEVPFFSPDGQSVGFFSPRGTLKVVPVEGGEAVPVARSGVGYAGASWGPDGFIYADADGEGGLVRVRASGGTPEPFTTVDAARREREHIWPEALPGGKAVLFVVKYQADQDPLDIAVADVATGRHEVVVPGHYARYAASGHLLYVRWPERSVRFQPFDAESATLSGESVVLTEDVWMGTVGAPHFVPDLTISRTGTLMTTTRGRQRDTTEVVWVAPDGTFRPVDPAWNEQLGGGGGGRVALSPDGKRLAVTLGGEIWIKELDRGPLTKLTFGGGFRPDWSPDGGYVAFISTRDGIRKAYRRRADGTGSAELLLAHDWQIHEVVHSADGEWLVYRVGGGGVGDLYAVRVDGEGEPIPLVVSHAQESQPALSPDGRWLAYMSLETGRPEIWVRPFPNTAAGSWRISPDGGTGPQWARDGKALFYRDENDDLVSVGVTPGTTFTYGPRHVLFSAAQYLAGIYHQEYAVGPDGRFVFVRRLNERRPDLLVVYDNVFAAMKAAAER